MKTKTGLGIVLILVLVSCHSGYKKENGQWMWVSYDESAGRRVSQIDEHDSESFFVLKNDKYAKDKSSVFYVGNIIQNADPKSFEVINKNGYSKDKQNVFLGEEKVIFANPKTFEILEFPYSKDDKHIFCGTLPLKIEENMISEFKVTNEDKLMSATKSTTKISHFIELNPDYQWLDTLGINNVIVGEWATGETNQKKFKGFKEVN